MADISELYIHQWRKQLFCLCTVGEDCLRLLLRCLNPDPNFNTDERLAILFKNYPLKSLWKCKTLDSPNNFTKVYDNDATGVKVAKDTINIDELDITVLSDVIKNLPGFDHIECSM